MKILYLVNMDPQNKTGLFNATHKRIKLNDNKVDSEKYCINFYDGIVLKLLKKLLKKKIYQKEGEYFIYEDIKYRKLFLKNTITKKVLEKLGIDFLVYLEVILRNKVKIQEFDMVSAHWGHTQGSLAYYIKRFLGIPYALTLHGSDIHTMPKQSANLKKVIVRNLEYADENIFVSEYLQKEARDLGYCGNNFSIVYNGIDREKFYPVCSKKKSELRAKYGLEGYSVGYIGNLVEVKRVDKIPQIYKELNKITEDEFTFLIIGDGDLKQEMERKFNEIDAKFLFAGKVAPQEVVDYLSVMDVLILPSRQEGLGSVLLEAQACGIPVIGSSNGGIPEVIIDKTCIIKDDQYFEEKLAEKILSIFKNKYSINLPNDWLNNFDWDKNGEKELNLYKNIINGK
ncbi:hypothetical protein AC241_26180 [Bacillus thuringiensis]|uniref:glycosyltransferase n=1 Tax=Bacillus thuringiensis TaxID=1428 RepID=UPI000676E48F|nr:glycosyltransferase [Bacillus thuringiensis]AKR12096.1 hypothetical protein AC241_26180 [Bacillus thuringiensis]